MCFWKAHQERAVSEGLKKNGALAGGMAQLQLALLKRRVRFTQGGRCSDGVGVVRRSRERSRERGRERSRERGRERGRERERKRMRCQTMRGATKGQYVCTASWDS